MLLDLMVVLVLVRRAPSTTKTTTDVTLPSTTQKLAFRLSEEVPLKSTDQIVIVAVISFHQRVVVNRHI